MKTKTLVSFDVCPFVQRTLIVLEEKNIRNEYDLRYIDLDNKPDWFLRYSPTGKVPVLIAGETVLFESAAISEYIDDIGPGPRLHPQDALLRAHNRAWIEFLSSVLVMRGQMQQAPSEHEARELAGQIGRRLRQLERQLGDGPYFNGKNFSLVDAAAAPLFQRLQWLTELVPDLAVLEGLPKVEAWQACLMKRASVSRATGKDLRCRYLHYLQRRHHSDGTGIYSWMGRIAAFSDCCPEPQPLAVAVG